MIITDILSNFFSNIKNGYLSKKYIIKQQKSKQIINILNLLIKEGLIKSYKFCNKNNNFVYIYLKYKNNKPIITNIKKISKPGKRVYIKNKELFIKNNKGFYILSTSKGILTNLQAKQYNCGGELICLIL